MFLSSAEHMLLRRQGTSSYIQMEDLSSKDKLFIVLPFPFQLLTDFDYSLLDHLCFQMSRQPCFCFSRVKVTLVHITRRKYKFPLHIFKHMKWHSLPGVLRHMTHCEMERSKKSSVSAVVHLILCC